MNLGSIIATILVIAFVVVFIYIAYIYLKPMVQELKRRSGFKEKEKPVTKEVVNGNYCPSCGHKL